MWRVSAALTPGSLTPQSPHFGAVPFFLMWRTRSSPPGVLIRRVRLDDVLYLFRRKSQTVSQRPSPSPSPSPQRLQYRPCFVLS